VAGAPAEFVAGAGLLGRSLGLLLRRPRLFWMGALPALITSVIFVVVLIALSTNIESIAAALSPFADGWSPTIRQLTRVVIGLGVLAGSVLIMVLTFTTLTLTLGSPLYDKISEFVDHEFPEPPAASDERVAAGLARALRQSVGLIATSAVGAVVFLLVGLIPVVGAIVGAVASALFGGWLLAIELIGSPLERRGVLTVRGRRELMRQRRFRVWGLGVPTFLLLSLPFVGVVVFPVATAAGTILARQLLGESTTGRPVPSTPSGPPGPIG
jgi:CysZ protein